MKKLLILVLLITKAYAQSFQFQATVGPVTQTGYQRIRLPPAVVEQLSANLADIRLYDEQKQEVPYLLTRQLPGQKAKFRAYEVVSKTMTPRGTTTLVLRNAAKSRINSLGLVIKNTNVTKTARLSGSNDAKTWYGIVDDFVLEPVQNSETTSDVRVLDFPLSDYEFYQLAINDSVTAPLNILSVGYYATMAGPGTYTVIPDLVISQRDTLKRSLIHLAFAGAAQVDKLTISVKAPAQYRRRAEFCQLVRHKGRRGRQVFSYEPIRVIDLRSDGNQTIYLSGVKAKDLYLFIDNQDNPPLVIDNITAYQAAVDLVANLTRGMAYQLRFGNPNVSAPMYDLVYFKQKLPVDLPILPVAQIEPIGAEAATSVSTLFTNPWIIWPALGLVLGLLGFMSYRMLGELGKG